MGRPKIKIIESVIEPDKLKDLEPKLELSEAAEEEVSKEVKEAKKNLPAGKARVGKPKVRSVRYKKLIGEIDRNVKYALDEALEILKKTAVTKFDSTLEAHFNLGIDTTKSDQVIRRSINLPHGLGRKVSVLVFADGIAATEAKKAGAEIGTEKTLEEIAKGKIGFDRVVATPDWMPRLAKVAKVLGPKGLMPNPKTGTVSEKPAEVVTNLAAGMIELKTEAQPIIHTVFGKASFKDEALKENIQELVKEINSAKPASFKKELIKSVYLSSTMGPSVKLDLTSITYS